MKKRMAPLLCTIALFFFAWGIVAANAHGDAHHPEPGHSGTGGSCNLSDNFYHYNHAAHYGSNHNIWCDGTNQQLSRHHGGNTVSANLPSGSSFVGGFCIRSQVASGGVLKIQYKDLVEHDKVWLKSGDQIYYPIDKSVGEHFILVEDNGWADRSSAVGQVEVDVLLSSQHGSGSGGGGGGGCDLSGLGGLLLAALVPAGLCLTRKRHGRD